MAPRVVRSGEHLALIAHRAGVDADEVWNLPANKQLKELRPGGHMLREGDFLELPKGKHPEPATLAVGGETTITAQIPKTKVHIALVKNGEPVAGEPWHIEARGEDAKGTSEANGDIRFEVRVTTQRVLLVLEKLGVKEEVRVGGLDPIDTTSGLSHRLRNIGYFGGAETSSMNAELAASIKKFQADQKLAPTGEVDPDTAAALLKAHGS